MTTHASTHDEVYDDTYEGRALVAAFGDPETARNAAKALHKDGFRRVWIGITHLAEGAEADSPLAGTGATGQTHVQDDDGGGFGAKLGRFFSGEAEDRSLYETLMRHGVADSEARRIDVLLPWNSAILTVDGHNHPERAAQLIELAGGYLFAGESFVRSGGAAMAAAQTNIEKDAKKRKGSDILGYGDAETNARGKTIDARRSEELRAERITTVPVMREETFVARGGADAYADDNAPITATADTGLGSIHVPILRQGVMVTRRYDGDV
jgi:hypothetical protein